MNINSKSKNEYRLKLEAAITIQTRYKQTLAEINNLNLEIKKIHKRIQNISNRIQENYNLNVIFEMCKNEKSLDEIAESCNISKSMASKRLQVLESLGAIKKIKVEKKIKFHKI